MAYIHDSTKVATGLEKYILREKIISVLGMFPGQDEDFGVKTFNLTIEMIKKQALFGLKCIEMLVLRFCAPDAMIKRVIAMDAKASKAQIEIALNLIPMEILETATEHAYSFGESLEHFVMRSILETIERDRHPSCAMDDGIPEAFINYMASGRTGGGVNVDGRHQTSDNNDL